MKATCFVSDADFSRYFKTSVSQSSQPPMWNGEERRSGPRDRRAGHDRRWEQSRGRRFRVADRRKL